jgi:hypothetical protein
LARLRVDGFASLHAGPQPGTVLTVPVKVTGPKLYVNADAKQGELRTEIRDAKSGKAIPGYSLGNDPALDTTLPLREDAARVPMRWQENRAVSGLVGREVRLSSSKFRLHRPRVGGAATGKLGPAPRDAAPHRPRVGGSHDGLRLGRLRAIWPHSGRQSSLSPTRGRWWDDDALWNGDLELLRLYFALRDAHLYSFWFGD